MRRGIGPALFAWGVSIASSAYARSAWATNCSGSLSTCIDDDTLWPHAGPARFVAVGSTQTTAGGQLGFGLVSTYASRPIVIHVAAPGGPGSDQNAIDNQINGTFLWSYGVGNHLELDLALPLTFAQGGTGLAPVTGGPGLQQTAQRDIRFGFAYALAGAAGSHTPADGWGLLGRFEVSAPTGDRGQFAGEGSGVFVPSIAASVARGRWFAGAEVGARLRPATELLDVRVGAQIVTAVGVGFDVVPRQLLSVTLEGWALPALPQQAPVTSPSTADTPAEWQLAARTSPLPGGDLSLQLGGGGAIPVGGDDVLTQPRFRFTLGVRWAPQGKATPAPPTAPGASAP